MTTAERQALGEFLRRRRERYGPEKSGLPWTRRRRTPGLRREELAVLAGISVTWYSALEQGRDVQPSGQVLEALARALHLDHEERAHLLHLAGRRVQPEVVERLAPGVAVLLAQLGTPAYVTGAWFDVLGCNEAATRLFPALATVPGGNLVRWVLLDPVAREVLVDWDEVARDLLARLRTAVGRRPGHPAADRLVGELHASSAQVRLWWPAYDVRHSHAGSKRLREPDGTVRTYRHTALIVADAPDQVLVTYQPEGPEMPVLEQQVAPSTVPERRTH